MKEKKSIPQEDSIQEIIDSLRSMPRERRAKARLAQLNKYAKRMRKFYSSPEKV